MVRHSGFYIVNGKRRHMTDFKADGQRAMGKEVEGPLEDKSLKTKVEDKRTLKTLRAEAKDAGISGFSTMGKPQLLEALNG